jgi:hypothetical protein
LSLGSTFCYARVTDEKVMQSSKHLAALGLLGAFGVLIAAGSRKPVERFDPSSLPPVDRRQTALVTSYVVSASDVCVRANAPDPTIVDAASLQALRDACNRAADDQARALNWQEDDWEIVHPGTENVESDRQKPRKTPRVARRAPGGAAGDSTVNRNR